MSINMNSEYNSPEAAGVDLPESRQTGLQQFQERYPYAFEGRSDLGIWEQSSLIIY